MKKKYQTILGIMIIIAVVDTLIFGLITIVNYRFMMNDNTLLSLGSIGIISLMATSLIVIWIYIGIDSNYWQSLESMNASKLHFEESYNRYEKAYTKYQARLEELDEEHLIQKK